MNLTCCRSSTNPDLNYRLYIFCRRRISSPAKPRRDFEPRSGAVKRGKPRKETLKLTARACDPACAFDAACKACGTALAGVPAFVNHPMQMQSSKALWLLMQAWHGGDVVCCACAWSWKRATPTPRPAGSSTRACMVDYAWPLALHALHCALRPSADHSHSIRCMHHSCAPATHYLTRPWIYVHLSVSSSQ